VSAQPESPSGHLGEGVAGAPGGDPTEPVSPGSPDAADAAGVGDIGWATEPRGSTPATEASENAGQGVDPLAGVDDDGPLISAEDLVQDLERVTVERDQYLDTSRRLQAEFENYRKAVAKRETDARERANESLIAELLPVLDACDGALATGATDVEPVRTSLVDTLTKQGLTRIDDVEAPFDPERHEAVIHDPDGEGEGPVVAEVMRAGYLWKGRVVRPAMVRVRG